MTTLEETVFLYTNPSPKTILVVDDSLFIRRMLERMMDTNTPYQPIVAANCAEAIEIAGIIKPHLFLFDYQMPDMSGLELYDRLHAKRALRHIPAIIMSSELPRAEIEKRNILGVEKPFHLNILFRMIESVVQSTQVEPTSNHSSNTTTILALAF